MQTLKSCGNALRLCVALVVALAVGCESSSSTDNGSGGGRTPTTTTIPADVIDSHASVLPSSSEGGALACPPDYKTCGDGGCCPATGACTDGFTCEVAPTVCATCTGGITSGRCCQGNCCPTGSTCNSGVCRTKRAEATVDCGGSATAKCGSGCCPAGATCHDGVCELHGGTTPKCTDGSDPCDNGSCCPTGYSCSTSASGSSTQCEKDPAAPDVGTTVGTCPTGESVVLPKGSNCPAITSSNSSYLGARCCPTGSKLYCQSPTSTFDPQPTCLIAPTNPGISCPSGTVDLGNVGTPRCCPYVDSYPYLSDIDGDGVSDCYYQSAYSPSCSTGSVDPTTGKCCNGTSTGSGGCCPSGTSSCGTGCCDYADTCTSGKCVSYSSDQPTCPTDAARRCPQSDGSTVCCPLDTTCGSNGTCSCPLSANVDCGGFCATDSSACGCPSDHPDLCGGSCCLLGGCDRFGGTTGSCSCPPSATSCGTDLCCPAGTTCGPNQSGCFKCPADRPTLCGKNCCSPDESCVNGECVGCPASNPTLCGKTCCAAGELCSGGTCKKLGQSGGSGGSTSTGQTCSQYIAACSSCSYRVCITGAGSGTCKTWYETSSGTRYNCDACGSCTNAAQQVVQSCCPTAGTATP